MKKMFRKVSMLLLVFVVALCMTSPASAASINKKKMTVCTGQTVQLKVNGTKKKANWSSSKKSVATVTSKGKVAARKKGATVITAKIGTKKYSCKVTVEAPKMSKSSIKVNVGKTYQLKMQNTKQKYTWSSKSKSIAKVTSKGKVTGKKAGTTYIYAKSASGKTFKCKVTVKKSSSPSIGQKNALARAKLYLQVMPFSYKGLIEQLEYDGFTSSQAKYGVKHCGADWYEQAAKKAELYMEIISLSRAELIEQLEFDGFTADQAEYGASSVGY